MLETILFDDFLVLIHRSFFTQQTFFFNFYLSISKETAIVFCHNSVLSETFVRKNAEICMCKNSNINWRHWKSEYRFRALPTFLVTVEMLFSIQYCLAEQMNLFQVITSQFRKIRSYQKVIDSEIFKLNNSKKKRRKES